MISRFRALWSNLFHRNQLDHDLDEELRAYVELASAERVRTGISPEEAYRATRREMGGAEQIKQRVRDIRVGALLDRLVQDVRYALRQMRKSSGFAATVVVTLTLGIGATTSIFTIVYSTLLRSLPYPEADRIVRIHDVRLQGRSTGGLLGVPRFFDLAARSKSFVSAGFFYFEAPTLIAGNGQAVALKGAGVNAGFWKVFAVSPFLGRIFDEKDDQPNAPMVAVVSYGAWQRIFGGDKNIIGRQVTVNQKSTALIGVMPKDFNVPAGMDIWRPAQFSPGTWTWRGEGSRFINGAARLAPSVSIQAAQSDLRRIDKQLDHEHSDTDGDWRFDLIGMRDDLYGELRPAIAVLFIASALLLLVACINVANLLLARATAREREVALRRALGASEWRIRFQFLTEATLLAVSGGLAGLSLTLVLVRTLAARLPGRLGIPGVVEVNWPVAWFAFGLAVVCGIGFGLAPAIRKGGTALNLNLSLKQGEMQLAGGTGGWARNVFISAQVAISLVLLVGAFLLGESLWNLLKSPLGFVPEHLLTFRIGLPWTASAEATREFFANVQRRLEAVPGVIAVAQTSALPTEDWHARGSFDADWLPRTDHHDAVNAEARSISGDFLRALGTPLLSGRELSASDAVARPARVIVNRAFAQHYLPDGSVIGRHISNDTGTMEIVGVIADVRGTAGSLADKVGPEVYFPADGAYPAVRRSFIIRSLVPVEQLVPSIREAVHQADPQQAFSNVATMDELLDNSIAQPRMNMTLVAAFAGLALLLACVGIYGVVAWAVAQRVREIGVRMALGATRGQISFFFLNRALRAAILGAIAGTVAALLLMRLLRSQLYGVGPENPWAYIVSIAVLLFPVLIATLRPVLYAASINPVDALRAE